MAAQLGNPPAIELVLPGRLLDDAATAAALTEAVIEMRQSSDMQQPTKVTLTEPSVAGDYIVAERHPDGSLLLAPDTSIQAIRKRTATRPMTAMEFERHFGELPIDDEAFAEDLHHATPAGRSLAIRERERMQQDGISVSELRACAPEGRDGTRLAGCVKTYLPQPDGPWGMVFAGDVDPDRRPVLITVAFGVRHPSRAWQPSVYHVAHARLHPRA